MGQNIGDRSFGDKDFEGEPSDDKSDNMG